MQVGKAGGRFIYLLAVFGLLLGMLVACSNSTDELDEENENNQMDQNSFNFATENNGDSSGNEDEGSSDHSNEDESDGSNESNEDNDANTEETNEQQNEVANQASNDARDSEPSGSPSTTNPSRTPDTNRQPEPDQDSRPTLRSPVTSADDPRALRIGMLHLQEHQKSRFREDFTQTFEWEYPMVDIELESVWSEQIDPFDPPEIDTKAELMNMMTGDNPPDVMFLSYQDYRALMEESYLVALNPFLQESELDLDDFEPIVADGLANPQDDQTYGLVPYFTASALIYNKDLFDQMNMTYPRDRMTWEEVFTLAKQMTFQNGDKSVHGLMFDVYNYRPPNTTELWQRYVSGLDLPMVAETDGQMTLNRERWHSIFADMKDLYDSGVFPLDPAEGERYAGRNKFMSNTIAMGIVDYSMIRTIIEQTESGENVPNWDIVSVPVHSETPNVGAGVMIEPVIVINANGRNQADAWRLIEIIHSKEWAAQSEETYYYRFSTRKDHAINLSDIDYHKEALYLLRAPNFLFRHGFDHFGMKTYKQDNFISYGSSYLKNVFDGKMNISEALEAWEADWNVSNPYNQAEIDERLELGLGR